MSIAIVDHFRPVVAGHSAVLFDLWGVIHNGVAPFPGALRTLASLYEAGIPAILLSNAPRRGIDVDVRLAEMGIPRDHYLRVVASGDLVRHALDVPEPPFGRKFLFWGKPSDRSILAGLEFTEVTAAAEADFVLCAGLEDAVRQTVGDYRAGLEAALAHRLPLVCANPDYQVMHGDTLEPCAGALALEYERMGGTAHWYGKPFASAYDFCRGVLGETVFRGAIMVGDTIRTDIVGARDAGIASVLIASGIHAAEAIVDGRLDPGRIRAACADAGVAPKAILQHLDW
ncbi:MAG: TIGR01459 family HAD-type hydrolase [Pseudomonadota bacterium]|nr:TIGR01459 family HAD-type hydrolase [Pseudomonadota bacterium]